MSQNVAPHMAQANFLHNRSGDGRERSSSTTSVEIDDLFTMALTASENGNNTCLPIARYVFFSFGNADPDDWFVEKTACYNRNKQTSGSHCAFSSALRT